MDKVIISDTSCLIALSKIDKLDLLKNLYQEVLITKEVFDEFGGSLPEWIVVINTENKSKQKELEEILDKGEASSISLALDIENATLIIDEHKGRKVAKSLGIDIIGTIGIVLISGKMGLISDVISTILLLVNKGFRLSDKLIEELIEKYGRN